MPLSIFRGFSYMPGSRVSLSIVWTVIHTHTRPAYARKHV